MRRGSNAVAAEAFKALGHPVRLALLAELGRGPRGVSELVHASGAAQATVSKHLAVLRRAGLVACEPHGRCRVYSLAAPSRILHLARLLASLVPGPGKSGQAR